MRVQVLRTGVANLASVLAALERQGCAPELVDQREAAQEAERLVLPGVGAFGAAMAELRRLDLVDALRERVLAGRPTLAICLGLQLLARESEESPGIAGIGVIDAPVTRFSGRGPGGPVRVPQMGWNRVEPTPGARLLRPGFASFANTFKLDRIPPGWEGATAEHGEPFVAALEKGPVLACQLHPELSGPWGADLLKRWLEASC